MRTGSAHFVGTLLLLMVPQLVTPQEGPLSGVSSASAFAVLKGSLLQSERPVQEITGDLKGSLRELGNGYWEMKSKRGRLLFFAPRSEPKEFYLYFEPLAPPPSLSAPVLAALIAKSETVRLADAEKLELVLRTDHQPFGTAWEKLVVGIDDNTWIRTEVFVLRK